MSDANASIRTFICDPDRTPVMSAPGPVPALDERAETCAAALRAAERVLLVSHIDADGLTSAAVAATALERADVPFEVTFERQLDEDAIARIAETEYETVLFTDFGSGQLDVLSRYEADGAFTPVIADHHRPAGSDGDEGEDESHPDTECHLNPLLEGIDGASELSGAGVTYVLARALEADGRGGTDNRDLAALAVVGAVGDMQAAGGGLHGANESIVEDGVEAGVLEPTTDLSLYGKQTRPLPKLLEYASDVRIPGISNDQGGALRFLDGLNVDVRRTPGESSGGDTEWRTWAELTPEEKREVASALVKRAVAAGVPPGAIDRLVGTAYVLSEEPVGSELRDASEFSTLLNATARYDRADVGLAVCLGDREDELDRARTLLSDHRRNLSAGIDLVTSEGVTHETHVQWFHAGDEIRETIVGIVAGMAMGESGVSSRKPILAFAEKREGVDDGEFPDLKVSARATQRLVRDGLDLSTALGEAARAVGGDGGGHDVAAGATIPADTVEAFVELADERIGKQVS